MAFILLIVAYVVGPVRDIKWSLWQKSGASLVALRRREFARHAASYRHGVAPARASLWLLLACDFFARSGGVCGVIMSYLGLGDVCRPVLVKIYHGLIP